MIQWLPPSSCFPPHRVTHPDKAAELEAAFRDAGWDLRRPVLVGYPVPGEGRIQLLSGSHRWAAAERAGIQIPVRIVPYSRVRSSWGCLVRWLHLMREGD